jgi:hypothetical protein
MALDRARGQPRLWANPCSHRSPPLKGPRQSEQPLPCRATSLRDGRLRELLRQGRWAECGIPPTLPRATCPTSSSVQDRRGFRCHIKERRVDDGGAEPALRVEPTIRQRGRQPGTNSIMRSRIAAQIESWREGLHAPGGHQGVAVIIVSEASAEATLRVRTERCAPVRSRSSAAHNDTLRYGDA